LGGGMDGVATSAMEKDLEWLGGITLTKVLRRSRRYRDRKSLSTFGIGLSEIFCDVPVR